MRLIRNLLRYYSCLLAWRMAKWVRDYWETRWHWVGGGMPPELLDAHNHEYEARCDLRVARLKLQGTYH